MTTQGPDRPDRGRPPETSSAPDAAPGAADVESPSSVEALYFQEGRWTPAAAGEGSSVDIDALCARHPQLADRLREVHDQWRRFRSVLAERTLPFAHSLDGSGEDGGEGGDGVGDDSAPSAFVGQLAHLTPPRSRYRHKGQIALGGMGAILRVRDEPLRRDLAMKVALGAAPGDAPSTPAVQERALARFLEEALVTGHLDHPGVVPVHELGVDQDGQVFFTMRLVEGDDLRTVFEHVRTGRDGWNLTRALSTLLKACEALAFAHSKGVIHRDLKPANIMVGPFGEVYVMDWGLAKVRGRPDTRDLRLSAVGDAGAGAEAEAGAEAGDGRADDDALRTLDGTVLGTPAYMSPEQARGEVERLDTRSDVYAMGALLYELLTGRPPYAEGDGLPPPLVLVEALRAGPPASLRVAATVPAELEAICEKAMARDPDARYPDVAALADDLRAYLEHRVVGAYETGAVAELRKWVARNKGLAATLATVFLLVLGGGAGFAWLSDELADGLEREQGLTADLRDKQDALDVALADARGQRDLAQANATAAREAADLAETEARRAEAEARRAEAERSSVLRLSAFRELEALRAEADELWPATADRIPAFDAWLSRADALVAGLDAGADGGSGHRAQLTALRERAVPPTPEQRAADREQHPLFAEWQRAAQIVSQTEEGLAKFVASLGDQGLSPTQEAQVAQIEAGLPAARAKAEALERRLDERRTFAFATQADAWWHDQLVRLIAGIEAFADPETGLVAGLSPTDGWGIARRRKHAATVDDRTLTGAEARRRWAEAVASIADPDACPAYGGLRLAPQRGLLPIGRDPASGLWEFWHVATGAEPTRGADGVLARDPGDGVVLVLVPGGSFWMGAQAADAGARNHDPSAQRFELPVHEVTVPPFFLGKDELTQGQWQRITGSNPSATDAAHYTPMFNSAGRDWSSLHPVEQVSWDDARAILPRVGLDLPSEAAWEYACRAGTSTVAWPGDTVADLQGAVNLADAFGKSSAGQSWTTWEPALDDGEAGPAPAGTLRANAFGLHHMLGNVNEWCLDTPFPDYSSAPTDGSANLSDFWDNRVYRGGSYIAGASNCRSAARAWAARGIRVMHLGVRPARALDP